MRLMPYHGLLMDVRQKVNTLSHEQRVEMVKKRAKLKKSDRQNRIENPVCIHTHSVAPLFVYTIFAYAFSRCDKPLSMHFTLVEEIL